MAQRTTNKCDSNNSYNYITLKIIKVFNTIIKSNLGWQLIRRIRSSKLCLNVENLFDSRSFLQILDCLFQNVNQVYQYLIELRCRSNECLEGKFATLAAILNLMRSTDLWESCGAVMERQLIDFCGDRFSKSCIWLVAIKVSRRLLSHLTARKTNLNF